MLLYFKKLWNEKPLTFVLIASGFFRLIAVIFSKGFGMHDDHFLVIEAAQSWVDGFDYNDWLPPRALHPSGHSLFYVGLHYYLFLFFKIIGLADPQAKMVIVRLLHALLSLVTIIYGYRIAAHYSGKSTARTVGLLLGIYWFMPCLGVRNLVEMVCIPFLMLSTWMIIRSLEKQATGKLLLSGIVAGLAFSIRFQSVLFIGGMGLALLLMRQWKAAIAYGIGALLCMLSLQGLIDYYIWKKPFTEFGEYVRYNIEASKDYFQGGWYLYLLFQGGVLIPPVSIFLFFGFFRSWKKYLLLFLPSFIFLLFHIYFPNKQERFILPIVPFIILLGIMGWNEFVVSSRFWTERKKLLKACWVFFWVINFIPLPVVSAAYSKRSKVELMTYLAKKEDFKRLIVEESHRDEFTMPPFFYLGKWYTEGYIQGITSQFTVDSALYYIHKYPQLKPNYVVFFDDEDLDTRVENFKKGFPKIRYETTIEPGLIDKLFHWLNPINKNFVAVVYKIEE